VAAATVAVPPRGAPVTSPYRPMRGGDGGGRDGRPRERSPPSSREP
jgi:hypothetical protein